jgi:prepilin-type N-terminal cleavage/methylation domain-containing protein
MRPKRRSQAGFTLIEMMVVVSIIAIATAIAVPSMRATLAEQRASQAAVTIVRMGRQARNAALGSGRAQLIRISVAANSVTLVPGNVSGCNQNDWAAIPTVEAALNLDTDQYYNRGDETIELAAAANAEMEICYQPNGVVMARAIGGGRFVDQNIVGGGLVYLVERHQAGATTGVARQVLFPLGAAPRLRL